MPRNATCRTAIATLLAVKNCFKNKIFSVCCNMRLFEQFFNTILVKEFEQVGVFLIGEMCAASACNPISHVV